MSAIRLYAPVQPVAMGGPVIPPTNVTMTRTKEDSPHHFMGWLRGRGRTGNPSADCD